MTWYPHRLLFRQLGRATVALALAAPARSAQAVFISRLQAPDSAREAVNGVISPDGSRFVYEVVEGEQRSLWMLTRGESTSTRLTPAAGVRDGPAWSPDGHQLAYWITSPLRDRRGRAGLYVFDFSQMRERQIATAPDSFPFPGSVVWRDDGRIATGSMFIGNMDGSTPFRPLALWPDGRPAPLIEAPAEGSFATIDTCCGGTKVGLIVRDAAGPRCLAGPISPHFLSDPMLLWEEHARRLFLIELSPDAKWWTYYHIDAERRVAHRLLIPRRATSSVSFTRRGDLAFTVADSGGTRGSLWLIPAESLASLPHSTDSLLACPPIAAEIESFARRSEFGAGALIDELLDRTDAHLAVFSVTRRSSVFGDIPLSRPALWYGDRIGWIDRHAATGSQGDASAPNGHFPVRPEDAFLFSADFDSLLSIDRWVRVAWRAYLVRDSVTPVPVLLRILRQDAFTFTPLALDNPTLRSDSIPFEWRLQFAEVSLPLALAALGLPSIHDDPARLARIGDVPRYRRAEALEWSVNERFRALAPGMARGTSDLTGPAAMRLFLACVYSSCSASYRVLQSRSPRFERRLIRALDGALNPGLPDGTVPPGNESRDGPDVDKTYDEAVRRVSRGELAGAVLRPLLASGGWRTLDAISRLDERFEPERGQAVVLLGARRDTPDSMLRVLWKGMTIRPDWRLARSLLDNARARADLQLLRHLANLDPSVYGETPYDAAVALNRVANPPHRAPPPPPSPGRRLPHPPPHPPPPPGPPRVFRAPPPPQRPERGQCLLEDAWSAELSSALPAGTALVSADSICARASAALDSLFELPDAHDSVYVFAGAAGLTAAKPPVRPGVHVTLVRFDSTFVARARRVVAVP